MNTDNPVIKLCLQGIQAEFDGRIEQARSFFEQAWGATQDDFDACVAAHYMARHQDDPEERLYWNQLALNRANAVADSRVQEFYPSLFLNMGQSFELLGDLGEAKRYYDLAAALGVIHQAGQ